MSGAGGKASGRVFYVSRLGTVYTGIPRPWRLDAEAARCAAILSAATPPDACGPEIPVAPARGPQVVWEPRSVVRTSEGNWRAHRDGWQGRSAVRVGDAFDRMRDQAKRAHARKAKAKAKDAGPFVPPFDVGQEQMGREYAALVERVAASGMKCASLEAGDGGGGGARGVSEAVAADMARLSAMRRRIGDGLAKDKLRPSMGGMRSTIRARELVDQVCLSGLTITEVAARHGWGKGRVVAVLQAALRDALDRMRGYGSARPQHLG